MALGFAVAEAESALSKTDGDAGERLTRPRRAGSGRVSENDRLVGPAASRSDEDETDRSLRPRQLDDFVGQEVVREQLAIALAAATERGEPIDHVLLAGPPGLGKSTLAHIVASEMQPGWSRVSGPGLDRKGDLVAILADLAERDVVFIDEVHRLNRSVEETLYPAMEDGVVDIIMGQGAGARSLRLDLAPFTLIGATTRASLLTKPLRDRFGIVFRLDHYSPAELVLIARRSAGILGIRMQDDAAAELAQRVARNAAAREPAAAPRARLRAGARDGAIDDAAAVAALDLLGVDAEGLDRLDRELLRVIAETFEAGPVGLSTLADAIGEDRGTIEDVYEPYLLQKGLLQRTPRGRVITRLGRAHLGHPDTPPGTTAAVRLGVLRREAGRQGDGPSAHAHGPGHPVVQRATAIVECGPHEPGEPGQAEHDREDPAPGVGAAADQHHDADRHEDRRRLQDLRDALARRDAPAADRPSIVLDDVRVHQPFAPAVPAPREQAEVVRHEHERGDDREVEALAIRQQRECERERSDHDHEVDHGTDRSPPEPGVPAEGPDRPVREQQSLRAAVAATLPGTRRRLRADVAGRLDLHLAMVRPHRRRGRALLRYVTWKVQPVPQTRSSRRRAPRSRSAAGMRPRWRRSQPLPASHG